MSSPQSQSQALRLSTAAARVALFTAALALAAACSAPGDGALGTNRAASTSFANDKPAYDYFAAKGLTNFQAAGIVGNLDQESGVDPNAVQSGGPGRGIAQWSVGGRWDTDSGDNLVAYAAQQGQATSSLSLQLDFIWFELETFSDYGLAKLRATTNVTDATIAFETDFEGCAACDESTRIGYAEDVLAAYGADPVSADAGTGAHDAGAPADASARDAVADQGSPTLLADDAGAPAGSGDSGAPSTGPSEPSTSTSAPVSASGGCAVAAANGAETGSEALWLVGVGLALTFMRRRSVLAGRAEPSRSVSRLSRALA